MSFSNITVIAGRFWIKNKQKGIFNIQKRNLLFVKVVLMYLCLDEHIFIWFL